ncbi:hypothetical protein HY032_02930 [Candidatus Gottesmanbacteria bacterium]|nr:hypothetical protein [Candidatus Gottesmanbacteria bacterium]
MTQIELVPPVIDRLTGYPYGVDPNAKKQTDLSPKEKRKREIAGLGYPLTDDVEPPIRWTGEVALDPEKQ